MFHVERKVTEEHIRINEMYAWELWQLVQRADVIEQSIKQQQ